MIQGEDILCFAPERWDSPWRNRQHIMSILAQRNRVLYVEPRDYLRPLLRKWRRGEVSLREVWGRRVTHIRGGLHVYHSPAFAPISGRFPLNRLSDALYLASLRRAMARLGMRRPLLWLFRPSTVRWVGCFGEKLVIYHVVDEYSAYKGPFDPQMVKRLERELLSRAHLVLTTSRALWEGKRPFNPNTHWVPNAVDYGAFERALADSAPPPSDLAALKRPLIGYVGVLNEKIDFGLLRQVARRHPDWSLVLVGPVELRFEPHKAEPLRGLSNVHFLGFRPVEMVPYYIKACQVCLMPYELNEWTRHIEPLKLYEYLACGRPIVSTDIPAARRFSQVVYIARDEGDFVRKIEEALRERDPALAEARRSLARQNTWKQRVEVISELIQEALEGPRTAPGALSGQSI